MTIVRRNQQLRQLAQDAHHSSIEAHGEPVEAVLAWEFITQVEELDEWIGKPIPRVFAAWYAAWGRDWKRTQAIATADAVGAEVSY